MDTTQAKQEDVYTALQMCIGEPESQSFNIDRTKLLIKTTQSRINDMLLSYPDYTLEQIIELTFCVECTYFEAQQLMITPEWGGVNNEEMIEFLAEQNEELD
jgi:hypothetical protein